MSKRSELVTAAAQNVADQLKSSGKNFEAQQIQNLIRSYSSLVAHNQSLFSENQDLRNANVT